MTTFRINVKGGPPHLQERWSRKLSEMFNRHMEERQRLNQAQIRLRESRRRDLINQIFPPPKP